MNTEMESLRRISTVFGDFGQSGRQNPENRSRMVHIFTPEDVRMNRPNRHNQPDDLDFRRSLIDHQNIVRRNRSRQGRRPDIGFLVHLLGVLSGRESNTPRLNRNQLTSLPSSKYKKNPNNPSNENNSCTICQCEYEENEDVRNLPCTHMFHKECIDTWLVQNNKCPLCRHEINPS